MSISRYEELKKDAIKAIHHAIYEYNYYCKDEYLIAIQNVTDGYNVDFMHTDNGEWADELFEQACNSATDCAFSHKNTTYVVILVKSNKDCKIEFITERHITIKSRN